MTTKKKLRTKLSYAKTRLRTLKKRCASLDEMCEGLLTALSAAEAAHALITEPAEEGLRTRLREILEVPKELGDTLTLGELVDRVKPYIEKKLTDYTDADFSGEIGTTPDRIHQWSAQKIGSTVVRYATEASRPTFVVSERMTPLPIPEKWEVGQVYQHKNGFTLEVVTRADPEEVHLDWQPITLRGAESPALYFTDGHMVVDSPFPSYPYLGRYLGKLPLSGDWLNEDAMEE